MRCSVLIYDAKASQSNHHFEGWCNCCIFIENKRKNAVDRMNMYPYVPRRLLGDFVA